MDAATFEELVARARDARDPQTTVDLLGRAEALWTGDPLADLRELAFTAAPAVRWADQRLTATEQRLAALLDAAHTAFAEIGDRWGHSLTAAALAALRAQDGDLDAAIACTTEALALSDELGTHHDSPLLRIRLSALRAAQGDLVGAAGAWPAVSWARWPRSAGPGGWCCPSAPRCGATWCRGW